MVSKTKQFAKNTLIIFLGKFSTQFMSFLLLPLYTHYLLTNDYGFVDLIQTYISLFIPILTLRFDSAAFRFLIDARNNDKDKFCIITNILFSLFIQIIFFIIFFCIIGRFFNIKYFIFILLNVVAMMITNILLQIIRGLGKNKAYSVSCFITGITTLLANYLLIVILDFDAKGILISSIIANFICSIYLIKKASIFKYISRSYISKKKIVQISKYSIPMIPNSLSWWIVNVSDRSIISFFLGTSFNGIYTVSCKFSNILNSVFGIINISWQETASLYIDNDDASYLFSKLINEIVSLFICITTILIPLIAIFFEFLIGNQYISSYNYIPILLLANIFNVYIGLYGGIYVAKKMTIEIAKTTLLSAILNIILNILFINRFGLYAASMSTLISYFVITVYRHFDIKKFILIKLNLKKTIILFLYLLFSIFIFLTKQIHFNILNLFVSIVVSIHFNKKYFKLLFDKIKIFSKGITKRGNSI